MDHVQTLQQKEIIVTLLLILGDTGGNTYYDFLTGEEIDKEACWGYNTKFHLGFQSNSRAQRIQFNQILQELEKLAKKFPIPGTSSNND